jgi:hypothetical protein
MDRRSLRLIGSMISRHGFVDLFLHAVHGIVILYHRVSRRRVNAEDSRPTESQSDQCRQMLIHFYYIFHLLLFCPHYLAETIK